VVGAAGDQVTAGVGAGQPDRAGGGVRSVTAELHHLGAVDQLQEGLGAGRLDRRRAGEVAAAQQFALHGLDHGGIGVTEADGAVAHPVLDVLTAVHVPDPAAGAARDECRREDRILIITLGVGVTPARDQLMGPRLEGRRSLR
jgi:hypothetical protein